uniref:Elongator complex protein 4 n=1 Tax=Cynoglossus semilaevis TaxID=244447 RepID=A0A3P8WDF8_CYNSE
MAAPMERVIKQQTERSTFKTTSFQKKTRSKLLSIPGTRPSVQNGQLLVSSGVTSLDFLLEEDRYDSYSRVILKYFLAEGVVCRHRLFVAAAQENPDDILQELPAPILDDVAIPKPVEQPRLPCESQESLDSMKIAWRYQNLPKVQTALVSSSRFGHYYDVSKTMEPEIRQAAKSHCFYLPDHPQKTSNTHSQFLGPYSALLKSLQEVIRQEGFEVAASMSNSQNPNVLRIGLHSLGSALWGDDLCCSDSPEHRHSLVTFLYGLRALLRSSLAVAVITLPSHLIQDRALMGNITRLSDYSIALESFKGSERETNPLYRDYHGLLHVRQVPHLNCLASQLPDHKDLAFKLKRKQFSIERLHLPADLSETVSRVSRGELPGANAVASACGSATSGNKHLDF